jgi:glycosyltransferase involved in cell wall biosynthesis
LYHPPPHAEHFYCAPAEEYLLFPSRLTHPKRQSLVLESLARTKQPVRVLFSGNSDRQSYGDELKSLARKLRVHNRVEWLGQVSEEKKRDLYARALAVVYPPFDEDYGYVTLEAMLASKAVITCTDSGGPLEFVQHEQTGLISEPVDESLAGALDRVWTEREHAKEWGNAGRVLYDKMKITWPDVVKKLLS